MSLTTAELEALLARRLASTIEQAMTHVDLIRESDARATAKREEATKTAMEIAQKSKNKLRCDQCGNSDERKFVNFEHEGQITCRECGTVIVQGQIHDGAWVRKFEGDDGDVGFQGAPPDMRFSQEKNLSTAMTSADKARGGGGGSKTASRELALQQQQVELGLSNFGDRHSKLTRQGYKDDMKREIFEEMEEAANALQIHEWVVRRAQTLFAQVRDDCENLRDKQGCATACMLLALRDAVKMEHGGRKKRAKMDGQSAHGDDIINRFKCPRCGIGFGDKKSLRYHLMECKDGTDGSNGSSSKPSASSSGKG